MTPRPPRIVIVDDEPDIREHVADLLARRIPGSRITEARDALDALDTMAKETVDILITDFRMPDIDGLEMLQRAQRLQPGCSRILMTGHGDVEMVSRAINELRIEAFFTKPLDSRNLVRVVEGALEARQRTTANHLAVARAFTALLPTDRS